MCRRMICLTALLVLATSVATTRAGDDDSRLARTRKKGDNQPPVVIVVQHTAPGAPAATATAPIVVAPTVAAPVSGATVVNCSEGPFGTKCASSSLAKICPKLDRPKPAQDCEGCSTFRCEYRFVLGSCRAFFGEGRYAPKYPENCPCDK